MRAESDRSARAPVSSSGCTVSSFLWNSPSSIRCLAALTIFSWSPPTWASALSSSCAALTSSTATSARTQCWRTTRRRASCQSRASMRQRRGVRRRRLTARWPGRRASCPLRASRLRRLHPLLRILARLLQWSSRSALPRPCPATARFSARQRPKRAWQPTRRRLLRPLLCRSALAELRASIGAGILIHGTWCLGAPAVPRSHASRCAGSFASTWPFVL